MEGIKAVKAKEGVANYDVNKDATRQEMRSYVCGQCHVEYYFAGEQKRLTYPWTKGLRADDILAYYEENGFTDWTHKKSGAKVLKAQHPEFELWSQGTHAKAGVACADCHMPYQRVGAQKVSDHQVRSPLLMMASACQTCHRTDEGKLRERVDLIQSRHMDLRDRAMDAVVELIDEIALAADHAPADVLDEARKSQKRAQFLLDFAEAENSSGFHAPQEAARVLGMSLDHARKGRALLSDFYKAEAGYGFRPLP